MADEPPLDQQVLHAVEGGVARITINAPAQGNSLTMAIRDRIAGLVEEDSGDLAVRAIVIGAAGDRHFCTGANLGGPRPRRGPGPRARPSGRWVTPPG